jgi:hypothetical protein
MRLNGSARTGSRASIHDDPHKASRRPGRVRKPREQMAKLRLRGETVLFEPCRSRQRLSSLLRCDNSRDGRGLGALSVRAYRGVSLLQVARPDRLAAVASGLDSSGRTAGRPVRSFSQLIVKRCCVLPGRVRRMSCARMFCSGIAGWVERRRSPRGYAPTTRAAGRAHLVQCEISKALERQAHGANRFRGKSGSKNAEVNSLPRDLPFAAPPG